MGDKVALPSLSLPKQKTHWTVGVVIAAGVLFLVLGAAFYWVLRSRQAEADAYAKRESDHLARVIAETEKVQAEKARADSERAASEAKKKEVDAEGMAAQRKASANANANANANVNTSANEGGKKKSGGGHKNGGAKVSGSSKPGAAAAPAAPATPAPPPPKEKSKASKDIDDLLRSFK
jgi:hypothetical protein